MPSFTPGDAESFVNAYFPDAKTRPNQRWSARCPAHDDNSPSLSISQGERGILMTCFAHCSIDDICHALGIQIKTLMKPTPAPINLTADRRTEYPYRDEQANILYKRTRVDYADGHKAVYQSRPENGKWINDLNGVRRVLYRLPELLRANPAEPVYIVEGEKCADVLARAGKVVTTSGAANSWRDEFASHLADRVVIILPDNDADGRGYAETVARSIYSVASRVFVTDLPDLPPKGDVYDWLAAGHDASELEDMALEAGAWEPSSEPTRAAPVLTIVPSSKPATPENLDGTAPALPGEATAIYNHAAPCGAWLDEYVEFASTAAPMTPRSFHECAALFAASTAIARRLVLRASTNYIYPNLYTLFIAPSSTYRKTTGFRILRDLFSAADMGHYLLPQRMTPEAMLQELSINVPTNFGQGDQETKAQWLRERALASRRGWAIDEAQGLFDSLKRDFNTGLLPMLLDLYECPDKTTEQTIGRWRVTVHQAYVSFFGASTPAAMSDHLANSALWTNGLWARFILVTPEEEPTFIFFPPAVDIPASLTEGLSRIASLFPTPDARMVDIEDPDGTKRKAIDLENDEPPSTVHLAPGAWQAWEAYSRALFDLTVSGAITQDELHGAYNRYGTHLIKIAMILAAMDASSLPVSVELRHMARAQEIVEGWRTSLHRLRRSGIVKQEETMADRILAMLAEAMPDAMSTRQIYRPLGLSAMEARPILDELVKQGLIARSVQLARNGRDVEMWSTLCQGSGSSVNGNRVN